MPNILGKNHPLVQLSRVPCKCRLLPIPTPINLLAYNNTKIT